MWSETDATGTDNGEVAGRYHILTRVDKSVENQYFDESLSTSMRFVHFYTYFLLLPICLLCHLIALGQRSSIILPDCRGHVFTNEYNLSGKVVKNEALFLSKKNIDDYADFRENAFFDSTRFSKRADFSDACFQKVASFSKTYFAKWADFSGTHFTNGANFSESHFDGLADFRYTRFAKKVDFTFTRFTKGALFDNAGLPGSLILKGLRLDSLDSDIDFRQCHPNPAIKKCVILLNYTDVSKLILPAHLFTVYFDLNDSTQTRETREDEITRVYEQLIKKSKDLGLMSSAQDWDIEYIKSMNKHKWGILVGKMFNFFSRCWWNFGYDKGRVLWWWLPGFYILFSVINFLKLDCMVENVYYDEELGRNFYFKYGAFKTRRHEFLYALFYTAVIYFNFKLRHEAVNYRNPLGLLYLYIIYFVGTLHVAFGVLGYILKT